MVMRSSCSAGGCPSWPTRQGRRCTPEERGRRVVAVPGEAARAAARRESRSHPDCREAPAAPLRSARISGTRRCRTPRTSATAMRSPGSGRCPRRIGTWTIATSPGLGSRMPQRSPRQSARACGDGSGTALRTPLDGTARRCAQRRRTSRDQPGRGGRIVGLRGRGEIGIHAGFRCRCSEEREGSSPSARTLHRRCRLRGLARDLTLGKAILTLRELTESERGVLTEVDVAGDRR